MKTDLGRLTDWKLREKVGDEKYNEIYKERERLLKKGLSMLEIIEREDKIYKPY